MFFSLNLYCADEQSQLTNIQSEQRFSTGGSARSCFDRVAASWSVEDKKNPRGSYQDFTVRVLGLVNADMNSKFSNCIELTCLFYDAWLWLLFFPFLSSLCRGRSSPSAYSHKLLQLWRDFSARRVRMTSIWSEVTINQKIPQQTAALVSKQHQGLHRVNPCG